MLSFLVTVAVTMRKMQNGSHHASQKHSAASKRVLLRSEHTPALQGVCAADSGALGFLSRLRGLPRKFRSPGLPADALFACSD
jgi:hypothetical protein